MLLPNPSSWYTWVWKKKSYLVNHTEHWGEPHKLRFQLVEPEPEMFLTVTMSAPLFLAQPHQWHSAVEIALAMQDHHISIFPVSLQHYFVSVHQMSPDFSTSICDPDFVSLPYHFQMYKLLCLGIAKTLWMHVFVESLFSSHPCVVFSLVTNQTLNFH